MKKIGLLIFLGISLVSCAKKTGFTIEGTLDGGHGQKVYIDLMKINSLEPVDSVIIDDNNHFTLSGDLEQPSFAVLRSEKDAYVTLIMHPGDKIKVTAPYDDMENSYTVEGSADTQKFNEFLTYFKKNIEKLQELNQIYQDSINSPNINDIIADLDNRSQAILKDQKEYTSTFVNNNLGSLASLLVLYQQIAPQQYILDPMEDFGYFEKVDSALMADYPEADPVVSFHTQMTDLRQRRKSYEDQEKVTGIGAVAPEISLPGINGDTVHLSSTRGEYVLLDFWASWCKPCREENPNLVKNYKEYHSKGFEIFQVSLDNDAQNWKQGIADDHLGDWIHVGDMKYWQSPVVSLYNIQGIPMNFLLDKEGRIIAKNLRGEALSNKLKEIFE